MGEPTRKLIEEIAYDIARSFPHGSDGETMCFDAGDVDGLCELALEAIDARDELATLRKDAAIGRAVRHSGVTLAWLTERGRELRNSRGSLALSSVAYAGAHAQEIALIDAIASALREEGR